jgi:hypothetical protein
MPRSRCTRRRIRSEHDRAEIPTGGVGYGILLWVKETPVDLNHSEASENVRETEVSTMLLLPSDISVEQAGVPAIDGERTTVTP